MKQARRLGEPVVLRRDVSGLFAGSYRLDWVGFYWRIEIVLFAEIAVNVAGDLSSGWSLYAAGIAAQKNGQRNFRMLCVAGIADEPANAGWIGVVIASAGFAERGFVAARVIAQTARPVEHSSQHAFAQCRKDIGDI